LIPFLNMNTKSQPRLIQLIMLVITALIGRGVRGGQERPVVQLQTRSWRFDSAQLPVSTLNVQAPQAEFAGPAAGTNTFTAKLTVDLKTFDQEKTLLEIPNVLSVRLRQHDPQDRRRQNYPAFKMPDGSVPVLEANAVLYSLEHSDWKNMAIGIPLAMLKRPFGEHEIVLNFSGTTWTMYVDGELLDNDFPFGLPQWAERNAWKLDTELVKSAAIYLPGIKPESRPAKIPNTTAGIQYWTPRGHNSWVGDVETCFFQGRYHLFYLYDRRHHQSKFGCGAHYFEHLSTPGPRACGNRNHLMVAGGASVRNFRPEGTARSSSGGASSITFSVASRDSGPNPQKPRSQRTQMSSARGWTSTTARTFPP
jgi:hypothetical protein